MKSSGFEIPPQKVVGPKTRDIFRWLGLGITMKDSEKVELTFVRDSFPEISDQEDLTKRKIYRYCGSITRLTRNLLETYSAVLGDQIRSFLGRENGWDNVLQEEERERFMRRFRNQAVVWNRQTLLQPLVVQNSTTLTLCTDSSGKGFGWVLSDGVDVLCSGAKKFSIDLQKWHCNRKESFGILKALQAFQGSPFLETTKEWIVRNDNRTAISILTTKKSKTFGEIERIGLERLKLAILEIVRFLRSSGVEVKGEHLNGSKNLVCDLLSRANIDEPPKDILSLWEAQTTEVLMASTREKRRQEGTPLSEILKGTEVEHRVKIQRTLPSEEFVSRFRHTEHENRFGKFVRILRNAGTDSCDPRMITLAYDNVIAQV